MVCTVAPCCSIEILDSTEAQSDLDSLCVAAYPDLSVNEATMINVCSKQTVNESRVYLTLRDTMHVPVTPSMCRCTIRPTVSARLLALDVRLQNSTNHNCGPTAMKVCYE